MKNIPDTPEVRAARAAYDQRIAAFHESQAAMVAARDAFNEAVMAARFAAKKESPMGRRNQEIHAARQNGATWAALAREYNLTPLRIKQICEKLDRENQRFVVG